MEITPIERTIVEYTLTISAADAALAVSDPFTFGELIADVLRPHLPKAAPTRKPSAASQITVGKNGNGHKRGPKGKAGKGLAKTSCPECGKQIAAKFLPRHLATKHGTASAVPSSSTE